MMHTEVFMAFGLAIAPVLKAEVKVGQSAGAGLALSLSNDLPSMHSDDLPHDIQQF